MISAAWARRTAAEWHGGQASALYMLASSGATHDARHGLDTLLDEIDNDRRNAELLQRGAGQGRELGDLLAYVTAVGARGPQQGWADLPWPVSEDPWVAAYTAAGAALHAGGWALTGSTHPQADWLDFTDTWQAALTHHGHPAAVVRGPDGGPGAWAQVDHRLWTQVDPALARGFITATGQAGTDVRAALTGLAHIEQVGLELTGSPVTATFLYEGYRDWVAAHDPDQERVLAVGGAIEQAHLMARYAPVVDTAAALVLAEDPQGRDRPGVLEYEVINPVGWWLAEQSAGGPVGTDGLPATLTAVADATRTRTQAFLAASTPPQRRATPGGAPAAVPTTRTGNTLTQGAHR